MSKKAASCNFYYSYIKYENVKKFDHFLTPKISNSVCMFMNFIRQLYCLNMINLLLPYILFSSWYFFMISLRSFSWRRSLKQNCSEITYLLFTEKLLLMITIYIIWDVFVFFVIILLKDCILFNNLILFSKRKKKSYFLFVCSCFMVNPLWSALMNNSLVIFLEKNKEI